MYRYITCYSFSSLVRGMRMVPKGASWGGVEAVGERVACWDGTLGELWHTIHPRVETLGKPMPVNCYPSLEKLVFDMDNYL